MSAGTEQSHRPEIGSVRSPGDRLAGRIQRRRQPGVAFRGNRSGGCMETPHAPIRPIAASNPAIRRPGPAEHTSPDHVPESILDPGIPGVGDESVGRRQRPKRIVGIAATAFRPRIRDEEMLEPGTMLTQPDPDETWPAHDRTDGRPLSVSTGRPTGSCCAGISRDTARAGACHAPGSRGARLDDDCGGYTQDRVSTRSAAQTSPRRVIHFK